MKDLISKVFEGLAFVFDKIPGLNKLKGGRSILGFIGLAVVAGLKAYGVGDPQILGYVNDGLLVFIGLSLNAKRRE